MVTAEIAEVLAQLRPDRLNAYAPAIQRAKAAARFEQWRATVDVFAARARSAGLDASLITEHRVIKEP